MKHPLGNTEAHSILQAIRVGEKCQNITAICFYFIHSIFTHSSFGLSPILGDAELQKITRNPSASEESNAKVSQLYIRKYFQICKKLNLHS